MIIHYDVFDTRPLEQNFLVRTISPSTQTILSNLSCLKSQVFDGCYFHLETCHDIVKKQ